MRLRYDDRRGVLKLTCPARMSRHAALAWALEQRDWIAAQLAQAAPGEPFVPGATIPVEGLDTILVWESGRPRSPRLADGQIVCGGPLESFERRIEAFLKRLALQVMSREAADYSRAAELTPAGVSVGDAGSRWGSCSSKGRIRLSWRLILAPENVRRYVVAHEVAHLKHLDHGPEFKSLEARLMGPGLAGARADLLAWGPRLRRLGRH